MLASRTGAFPAPKPNNGPQAHATPCACIQSMPVVGRMFVAAKSCRKGKRPHLRSPLILAMQVSHFMTMSENGVLAGPGLAVVDSRSASFLDLRLC
jgi:hypothetical protein